MRDPNLFDKNEIDIDLKAQITEGILQILLRMTGTVPEATGTICLNFHRDGCSVFGLTAKCRPGLGYQCS